MGTSVLKRQSLPDGKLTIPKTATCARKPGQRKRARLKKKEKKKQKLSDLACEKNTQRY